MLVELQGQIDRITFINETEIRAKERNQLGHTDHHLSLQCGTAEGQDRQSEKKKASM